MKKLPPVSRNSSRVISPRSIRIKVRKIKYELQASSTTLAPQYDPSWLSSVEIVGTGSWDSTSFYNTCYFYYEYGAGGQGQMMMMSAMSGGGKKIVAKVTVKIGPAIIRALVSATGYSAAQILPILTTLGWIVLALAAAALIAYLSWLIYKHYHPDAFNGNVLMDQKVLLALQNDAAFSGIGKKYTGITPDVLQKLLPGVPVQNLKLEDQKLLASTLTDATRNVTNASCDWKPDSLKAKITPGGGSVQALRVATLDGYAASIGLLKTDKGQWSLLGMHATPNGIKATKPLPLPKADSYRFEIAIDPGTGQTKFWVNDKGYDMGALEGFKGGAHVASCIALTGKPGDHMLPGTWSNFAMALKRSDDTFTTDDVNTAKQLFGLMAKCDTTPQGIAATAATNRWIDDLAKNCAAAEEPKAKWLKAMPSQEPDDSMRLALHHQITCPTPGRVSFRDLRSEVV